MGHTTIELAKQAEESTHVGVLTLQCVELRVLVSRELWAALNVLGIAGCRSVLNSALEILPT